MWLTRGLVHCHAKPRHKSRIPDSIAIHREMGMVTVAWRDAKSNRVESMFPAALLRCKCIDPFLSLFFLAFSILHAFSLAFISFSVDHSIFSFLTTFSVGESYPCLSTHTPLSLSTAQKVVKRKKKREVDVRAGNAHAYDRCRTRILLTVWIISNRPLTFSPDGNSTRIFCVPGLDRTVVRFHSVTFYLSTPPLLFCGSTGEFWLFVELSSLDEVGTMFDRVWKSDVLRK